MVSAYSILTATYLVDGTFKQAQRGNVPLGEQGALGVE